MTILDTNVLSELMKRNPNPDVVSWVNNQTSSSLFITSITQAEILYGLELLPDGQRKARLRKTAEEMFDTDFSGRILPFDSNTAGIWANIVSGRKRSGLPISHFDAQIAAICRSYGAQLATRNTGDFVHCGIKLINPWQK